MLQAINIEAVKSAQLTPWAVVHKSTSYLARVADIRFIDGEDDLDAYTGAFLKLDDLVFALIRYNGEPEDNVTLWVPQNEEMSPDQVRRLMGALDVGPRHLQVLQH